MSPRPFLRQPLQSLWEASEMSEADIARFAKLYPTTLGPESQPALHSGCDAALTTPPACMTSRSLLLRVEGTRSISEDDVERYESRWPIGTKERVWLGGLLYSGLRRGDAASRRFALIRTGITVTIPILPALDEVLQAGPCGDLIFICGENDRSLTKEPSGNLFREACNAAGVAKSAHGVRKIGATRAANNGATVAELEAIFGWQGGRAVHLCGGRSPTGERRNGEAGENTKRTIYSRTLEKVRDSG